MLFHMIIIAPSTMKKTAQCGTQVELHFTTASPLSLSWQKQPANAVGPSFFESLGEKKIKIFIIFFRAKKKTTFFFLFSSLLSPPPAASSLETCAETRDPGDLQIFSLTLSQLSYRGLSYIYYILTGILLRHLGTISKGCSGNWAQDLSHPNRESCH